MSLFEQVVRSKIQELRTLFLATGGLEHNGQKGSLREGFVKRLFEGFLPMHFGVGSGVIVDINGRQSPQVDLLIYDKRNNPPILESGGCGVYPLDSVLRVIEVKSRVDKSSLQQFSKMVWALHPGNSDGLKMANEGGRDGGFSFYPVCCLFGFGTNIGNLGQLCAEEKLLVGNPNLVFVDGVGLYNPDYPFMRFVDPDMGVSMFVALVLDRIESTANSRSLFDLRKWLFTVGSR